MKIKPTLHNSILLIAGLLAACIGAAMLFTPVAFHASGGIELENNINLLSEMRGQGAAMLSVSLVILTGVFFQTLRFTAIILAPLLYLSYGFSRGISIALDGMPSIELLTVMFFEVLIGLLCTYVFLRSRSERVI